MDRVRDELFTGATLTADEHGGATWRDLIDDFEHALHRRRVADDVARSDAITHARTKLTGCAVQGGGHEYLTEHNDQRVEVQALGQVLRGTRAHRIHDRRHRTESR